MARFLCSVAFVLLALSSLAPSKASPLSVTTENAADRRASPSIVGRETLEEAAVHARELLQYRSDGIGTLASVFPADYADSDIAGLSIALQEYFAVYPNGDLVMLAMPISKTFHNALVAPEKRITFSVKDERAERERGKMWAANRRRVSMWGTLRRLKGAEATEAKELYNAEHPDAPFWDGPDGPHYSFWVRFEVYKVYYFGGFGDVAAIGMLDMDLYRSSVPSARIIDAPLSPQRPLPPDDSFDAPFFIQPA